VLGLRSINLSILSVCSATRLVGVGGTESGLFNVYSCVYERDSCSVDLGIMYIGDGFGDFL
jgi:hypothetical protein